MIDVFAVRPQSPVFDEASFKMKRVPMYEHLSNKFQNIYCRSIEIRNDLLQNILTNFKRSYNKIINNSWLSYLLNVYPSCYVRNDISFTEDICYDITSCFIVTKYIFIHFNNLK